MRDPASKNKVGVIKIPEVDFWLHTYYGHVHLHMPTYVQTHTCTYNTQKYFKNNSSLIFHIVLIIRAEWLAEAVLLLKSTFTIFKENASIIDF